MERHLFNLKFASKEMTRNASKSQKLEDAEKSKCKSALRKGALDVARVHAENAIRHRNQALGFLRMGARLDSVAARVQSLNNMRNMTRTIQAVTRSMDVAIKRMDLERVQSLMDRFDEECQHLEVASMVQESGLDATTCTAVPMRQVDDLVIQLAEEAGLEVQLEMPQVALDSLGASLVTERDELSKRLAQLRK
ncbi:charged multivesicular body protein 1b-2-like [Schistocerca nitens]|uniref:charged multivesicular body protein 1b-2-like n=1 Tax=Schistocerca nitens TaxID=7011 RepID=UPI002118A77F|nr:charged multivesicular body protein 1b-2-like [Schistocerca nitens]